MDETQVRLDDMRLMATLVVAANFTDVAARIGLPKQTVSRRVAQLETALGVRLVDRSTRSFRLTALGRGYAERCAEVVRAADEANRAIRGEATEVSGTLRVTADPLFGEQFLPPILAEFSRRYPAVRTDVLLTSRVVDLVDEGFDVAFRVGPPPETALVATRIADALLVFVASPAYLEARGTPRSVDTLGEHDLIALAPEGGAPRWAIQEGSGLRWFPVTPKMRVNHLGLARAAALSGLGIANLPYFACKDAVDMGKLRLVLVPKGVPFGTVYVVQPPRRLVTPRVRLFRELAVSQLRSRPELSEKPHAAAETHAMPQNADGRRPHRDQPRRRNSRS
ncbi:MAG: LysR family transcriptional regulator [Myxococcaceae bacterium]|nr:LysR family transcriptional regulator [Myxococcaceae bacterium]MCI0673388.1 LysR family transcriptional regulator [Myxococcaceae bacterium]